MTFEIEQEPDRVPRGLVRSAAVVVIVMIVASVAATLLLGRGGLGEAGRIDSKPPEFLDLELFDEPTQAETNVLVARERLRSYGWVDRSQQIIHVPLDVAIEHYLAETHR